MGQPLTGRTFLGLVKNYIDILNSEETLSIKGVWENLCKDENVKALKECVLLIENRISEWHDHLSSTTAPPPLRK
jgi:hypothetical protein